MILKALAEYYERMLNDPECDVAPPGWFYGRLDYLIVLDRKGNFNSIRSIQTEREGRLTGRTTLLPFIGKQALKHTNSGNDANLLWDNATFVFGLGNKGDTKIKSFISTMEEKLRNVKDEAVGSILAFLRNGQSDQNGFSEILEHPEYGKNIMEGRVTLSFQYVDDENPVFMRKPIKDRISTLSDSDAPIGTCLVTGEENQPIELCHVVIKNLKGAKKDPNVASFNKESFTSYGKSQSLNSPVSKKSAFAYTTALNHLLRSGSLQRIEVGDATTVFWTQFPNSIEDDFSCFLGEALKGEEEVSYGKIRSLFKSVKSGVPPEEEKNKCYILGLAPMEARVAVRFWFDDSIKTLKKRIVRHFEDIAIIHADYAPPFLSMKRLLLATSRQSTKHPFGEESDIAPKLAGDIFRAVITDTPYPLSVLQKIVNRVKAEQGLCDNKGKQLENVTYARAALIKGYLVRVTRIRGITIKEVGEMIDKTYENIGYVLGRLFASLEKIQVESHRREGQKEPNLNKTIRDTYFSAATSNPLVIFKRLQDLSIHHLAKIRNSGKSTVWLDKLMREVMDKIPASGIPITLSLEDQGRFAVGYYHQRQDFFNKKEDEDKGE